MNLCLLLATFIKSLLTETDSIALKYDQFLKMELRAVSQYCIVMMINLLFYATLLCFSMHEMSNSRWETCLKTIFAFTFDDVGITYFTFKDSFWLS